MGKTRRYDWKFIKFALIKHKKKKFNLYKLLFFMLYFFEPNKFLIVEKNPFEGSFLWYPFPYFA